MKLKWTLKQIEKEMESFQTRNGVDPIFNFYKKVGESVELVTFIEKNSKSRKIKLNARKNYVINLVTAVEVYFKDLVKILPDFGKVKLECEKIGELLDQKMEKVTIVDAFLLSKRNKLRIGDFIAVSNKFENLENIDTVFSKILGLKFLDAVERHKHKLTRAESNFFTVDTLHLAANLPDWRRQVGKLFEKRHEVVHQVCFKDSLSFEEISTFWWRLVCFVYAVDFYIRDKFLEG